MALFDRECLRIDLALLSPYLLFRPHTAEVGEKLAFRITLFAFNFSPKHSQIASVNRMNKTQT